ncbi:hypothetical protein BASA81_007973 [Batrachochytrium salamandrivorans]|nr:hypothetical protein BASA81_007973 [Batrachochytrium salamandrivorans]
MSWLESAKARLGAYVEQIPGQTKALFGSVLALGVLNIVTLDLVSSALALDRTRKLEWDDPFLGCVLVLSMFSSAHGLFSSLIAVYFGNFVFSHHELAHKSWTFFPSLGLAQLAISGLALQVDSLWGSIFPLGEAAFAPVPWGGLLPLVCFLESAYSLSTATETTEGEGKVVQLPLPFTIPKRARGLGYAVIFSLLRGGDVDLFCASALGYLLAQLQSTELPRSCWPQQHYSPLPTTAPLSSQDLEAQTDAERRALFLAATERRLNKSLV